jgi:decaprenylphospho-beta-D-erythro-pentofuranosid-2-ulose 2-reductase
MPPGAVSGATPGAPVARLGRRVLVLGGSSQIALAIVRELAARAPREAALLGRDRRRLERAAAELRQAGGCERVLTGELDALRTEDHEQALARAIDGLGGVDVAILALGVLGRGPDPVDGALDVLRVNLVGCASLLLRVAGRLRDQGGGSLVVLSSVAAERPRRSNAVYGASKAGLDALAQALGDELRPSGARVLVVRPGFVHTRMTAGLRPAPLSTTPQAVARVVADGLQRGSHTVWAPRSLRWVMWAVRLIPRPVFRRLSL